jgi:hypothetical protein
LESGGIKSSATPISPNRSRRAAPAIPASSPLNLVCVNEIQRLANVCANARWANGRNSGLHDFAIDVAFYCLADHWGLPRKNSQVRPNRSIFSLQLNLKRHWHLLYDRLHATIVSRALRLRNA